MALNKKNLNNLFYIFVTAHLIIWTLVPTLTNNNLPLDTIEHLAWGSNLDWGFDKHPPMVAVFLEIFYQIFGSQDWSYYFLSQLFVIISFYFVFRFSNEIFSNKTLSLLSVFIIEAIYFYNFTYNPVHYMDLPELFMEYICSMTGKSPSTTGAGSEGALTKGPFNALPPIIDLNNALVSMILTGHDGFVTAAGYIGPKVKVAHDVSMLIPEVWCRMSDEERSSAYLISHGYLERCEDLEYEGKQLPFSRLGYRINRKFVRDFFGRVFNHPHAVFTEEMIEPEKQDWDAFVEGLDNIVATQVRVASLYMEDRSIEAACPPLKALLQIMLDGQWQGKTLSDPEVRDLFKLENMLESKWYQERLEAKQALDVNLWKKHAQYLETFLSRSGYQDEAVRLNIEGRLEEARASMKAASQSTYLEELKGTLGTQPLEVLKSHLAQ
jgi:hypothetical protein